jgi:hypothetical protein
MATPASASVALNTGSDSTSASTKDSIPTGAANTLPSSQADDVEIVPLTEADIPGVITCIQEAFEDDPYNRWIFPDRDTVSFLF